VVAVLEIEWEVAAVQVDMQLELHLLQHIQ
jgi:hypothetical protein